MPVFVILSLAVLAMAVGAVVVALLQVGRAARDSRDVLRGTREQIEPLTEELQAELAVTSTEVDALGRRVAAFGAAHQGRRGRRKGRSR